MNRKLYIYEVVSENEKSNALQIRPAEVNQLQPRGIALYRDIVTDFLAETWCFLFSHRKMNMTPMDLTCQFDLSRMGLTGQF